VNCCTDFSAWDATAKLVRESAAGRTYLDVNFNFPDDFNLFVELSHGAAYMGRPEQRQHFDFLLKSQAARSISNIASPAAKTPESQLSFLLDRFRDLSMEVYAVDMTTDELRDAGLWVVRVLIPALVPMSPIYSSRFLGHPRLYSYPPAAGFGPRTRGDVNPLPQPFA
jgi:ribosomal protein S12 methylthiotransferase accessory factor